MKMPDFFADIPKIRLYDPLAEFLGAAEGGIIEYSYLDAVKLAGHSCPTVAAAFGLTRQALLALHGDSLPERGAIRVEFAADIASGVTGVTANVISMLTGAAGGGGFKGLAGRFKRQDTLAFSSAIPLAVRFTRQDNMAWVDAVADLARIPAAPELGLLMQRCLSGNSSPEEDRQFKLLWQDRVRQILLDHADDPEVFILAKGVSPQGRPDSRHSD